LQPRAKQALHEIMYAKTRAAAERELTRFSQAYRPEVSEGGRLADRRPGPALRVLRLSGRALEALRTTNPIESTLATVRLREGVTKGAGSRTAGLVMAFNLLLVAEGHWRRIDAAELVLLVRAGVAFEDGVQIEPPPTPPLHGAPRRRLPRRARRRSSVRCTTG
jgi:putative transposase